MEIIHTNTKESQVKECLVRVTVDDLKSYHLEDYSYFLCHTLREMVVQFSLTKSDTALALRFDSAHTCRVINTAFWYNRGCEIPKISAYTSFDDCWIVHGDFRGFFKKYIDRQNKRRIEFIFDELIQYMESSGERYLDFKAYIRQK